MSCLRVIGRFIALFIIFMLVIVTPSLLLAYNAQEAAMSGDFVEELFEDTAFFEDVIREVAQDLPDNLRDDRETRDMSIAYLDAGDWERVLYVIAPPETLQGWAQDGLDNFRRWMRRGGRFLDDVILPFGEMRDNLVNDPQQTVLRALTEALPPCSGGQETLGGTNDLIPQCRPPESRLASFYRQLGQRWQEQPREVWRQLWPEQMQAYTDDISLADFVENESGQDGWDGHVGWRATRWGLRVARWLFALFIGGQCLVALGLAALLAARNLREALRWVGTPVLLIGAFTILLAFIILVSWDIGTLFIPEDEFVGSIETIKDASSAFIRDLWPPMVWQGGVLIMIGLGLWVLSFFTQPPLIPVPAPAKSPATGIEPEAAPPEPTPEEVSGPEPGEEEKPEETKEPSK